MQMTDAKGVVLPIDDDMPDWHKRLREHLNLLGSEADWPVGADLAIAGAVAKAGALKSMMNHIRFAHLSAPLRDDRGNLSGENLFRLMDELKARADAAGVRV
jgi:putative aminopeptidase FrvX